MPIAFLRCILTALLWSVFGHGAQALSCSASVTNLNFGSISVRDGVTNATSGLMTINCSQALVSLVGVCVAVGAGSGGSSGPSHSPRYLRNAGNAALNYELRLNGNGAANGTLRSFFVNIPVVLGKGSATIPIYADITSSGFGVQTGTYASQFQVGQVSLDYGVVACGILGQSGAVAPFSVTGTVGSSCEVDSTALNFGNLPAVIASPVDASATLNVRCTSQTDFSIRLGMGQGIGVTDPTQRRVSNGIGTLTYGLYQNAARTAPWGNSGADDLDGTGQGSNQSFGIFGRINGGQTALPGVYSDNVMVTIEY